jgi:hypothetical protein
MIHYGNLNSPRLAKALAYLEVKGGAGATTLELQQQANDMAVHTTIAEIRANGKDITTSYDGMQNGRKVYRYTLAQPPAPVMVPMAPVEVVQMQDGQLAF